MTNELRYSSGLTLNELNSKVDKLWSQLWDDPRMQQEGCRCGNRFFHNHTGSVPMSSLFAEKVRA